ncbi:MAG: extracellular solute-binding protein, partial [Catenulispora sp.]|nr:extracellular solute-binding protein [Catenulispora sp.]
MTRKTRKATAVLLGLGVVLAAAGCAGGSSNGGGSGGSSGGSTGSSSGGSGGAEVKLTVWQNSTTGPGQQFWLDAAKEYHTQHPNVTINVQTIQNEDMDGKLQTALNSNSAPDIFLQRGGGKMQAMVNAGQVQELHLTDEDKKNAGAAALAGDSIDGKVYAMPMDTQPEGFYYSKDLFKQAGITATPTTIDELKDAVTKLK